MATKVLIAGGAGFIGSHLSKKLLDEGYTVGVIDNLLTGVKDNIVQLLDNPQFMFFQASVTDSLANVAERMGEINYIFHLASPASPNEKSERSYIAHPIETMLANSTGTYNLLTLAKEKNAKLLYASSSEVYGNPAVSPQPETYWGYVNPNGIRSVYDEGKRFGEAMCFGFVRKYDTDVRAIRIFNTYGPKMHKDDGRAVTAFINQALQGVPLTIFGDGSQTRSFCYVDDLINGITRAMFTDNTKGQVFNLGNPDERTIKEFAELIKKLTGSQSEITYEAMPQDDPVRRKPDIEKARQLLHWEPTISLEAGLQKTIAYFREK
jgi:nucleoside-diphosphate-sugar epimerase